jgi:glycosyltransferase involved in cell wall biosynthesis
MNLSKYITIVIPCKNESRIIDLTLSLLNFQKGIDHLKVIVADSSDDDITKNSLLNRKGDKFNLEVISGGLPSVGRNNGSKIVTTPYLLFMDSDMFILDHGLIINLLDMMVKGDLDLLTTKVRTTNGKYNYVFKIFDIIQKLIKPFGPFCLGGFMMFNKFTFDQLGGFDESATVAEDYLLSKKVTPNKFKLSNKIVFTTPRRFEEKGIWYMVKLMISSFLNRNNKKFFSNHNTYWK